MRNGKNSYEKKTIVNILQYGTAFSICPDCKGIHLLLDLNKKQAYCRDCNAIFDLQITTTKRDRFAERVDEYRKNQLEVWGDE